jgi:transposase
VVPDGISPRWKARRFQAARLFARGESQAAVARALAVTPMTACRWHRAWKAEGRVGLKAAGRAGRKPRLDAQQLAEVDTALRRGAQAHGFRTELWTLPRVTAVIERVTGVRYHPGHVWYLLRRLNWSLQRPARRARERDERAIRQWVRQRWPTVKNARRQRAWLVFEDESGLSTQPVVRRTGAPRGEPPVLTHPFRYWQRLSVAAALAFRWDGHRSRRYFQTRSSPYTAAALIDFLRQLRGHFRERRVILLWDGLPAHRSGRMRHYLAPQRGWLTVERLPAYAPDLNPAEPLFGKVKGGELANHCGDLPVLAAALRHGLARVRRDRDLAFAFLRHTGLRL